MTFEEYWENKGSRIYAATHEERARLAWKAAKGVTENSAPCYLCGVVKGQGTCYVCKVEG